MTYDAGPLPDVNRGFDMIDGITDPCIFCLAPVRKIDLKRIFIKNNILKKGTLLNSAPNAWFSFLRQVDGFGVASSLEIENPAV